jgi:hypothetical protein
MEAKLLEMAVSLPTERGLQGQEQVVQLVVRGEVVVRARRSPVLLPVVQPHPQQEVLLYL